MEQSSLRCSRSASSSHWNRSKDARLRSGDVPFTRIDVSVEEKGLSYRRSGDVHEKSEEYGSEKPSEEDDNDEDADDEVVENWRLWSHFRVGLLDTVTVMGYFPVTNR
jgi:hypothetical protein